MIWKFDFETDFKTEIKSGSKWFRKWVSNPDFESGIDLNFKSK